MNSSLTPVILKHGQDKAQHCLMEREKKESVTNQFFFYLRVLAPGLAWSLPREAPACLSMRFSAGAEPRGSFGSSLPRAQPCLGQQYCSGYATADPIPHLILWAVHWMDAQAAALLSSTEIILFWSEGLTGAGSKSGPLPPLEYGRKVSLLCLRAQGTARHCPEMWQESIYSWWVPSSCWQGMI